MPHYIAVIHKEADSAYGISFPDVPGVIACAETLDAALRDAAEALAFAAEDWEALTASPFPAPRTLDALRDDPTFVGAARDAIVAAIPLPADLSRAA